MDKGMQLLLTVPVDENTAHLLISRLEEVISQLKLEGAKITLQELAFSAGVSRQPIDSFPVGGTKRQKALWYRREGFSMHIAGILSTRYTPAEILNLDLEHIRVKPGIGPATTEAIALWRRRRAED